MPLVTMKEMIHHASRYGYTLGGFQLISLDSLAAVIEAAESCRAPVLLDISRTLGPGDSGMLLAAAEHAARQARVPIGLMSTHLTREPDAIAAVRDGSNGLSIDLAGLAPADKITQARSLAQLASQCGVPVEGLVAQMDGDAPSALTFVDHASVDVLAYSLEDDAVRVTGQLQDIAHALAEVRQVVPVPLAIYASDLDDSAVQTLREAGVALIHFTVSSSAASVTDPGETGRQRTAMPYTRDEIREYVQNRLLALHSTERAAAVLSDCARWEPVEHVIVFNVETQSGMDINSILARGREVLSDIPGVRYVYTGQAVQSRAAYRFCWLVRFVHPAVIDSYREHPEHKKFADELFRPIAPTRMSIDFYLTTDSAAMLSLREPEQEPVVPGAVQGPDRITAA